MNKELTNFIMKLQKRQGFIFNLILAVNELCIKFVLMSGKKKLPGAGYRRDLCVNGTELVFRTMSQQDLPALENFFKRSIRTEGKSYVMPHKTDVSSLGALFRRASHIPIGIFHKDALIGYALVRLIFPDKASYSIFIADDWQGKGIGTAALEMQLKLIRDTGFVPYSAVSKDNIRSIKMLKKLNIGFTKDLGDFFEVKDMDKK